MPSFAEPAPDLQITSAPVSAITAEIMGNEVQRISRVGDAVRQADWAREAIARDGLSERAEVRFGDYRDINPVRNQIDGASVPCGVRIRAYQNPDFGGTEYMIRGLGYLE